MLMLMVDDNRLKFAPHGEIDLEICPEVRYVRVERVGVSASTSRY